MFGIRRITINSNELIGDIGAEALHDAFKSDLWLKALDLQNCGITTHGANFLLEGLKFNAMMHVLDVRLNVDIDRDTLQKIMEQVMINSSGNNTDYEWMDLAQTVAKAQVATNATSGSSSSLSKKIKKRRTTNASFSKKTQFIQNGSFNRIKRCKSTGSVINNKSPTKSIGGGSDTPQHTRHNHHHYNQNQQQTSGGIPWRAAARANRYRVASSCAYRNVNANDPDQENINDDDDDEFDDQEELDEEEEDNDLAAQNKENEYYEHQEQQQQQQRHSHRHVASSHQKKLASSTFDYEKFASNKILPVNNSNSSVNKYGRSNAKTNKSSNTLVGSGSLENLKNRSDFVSNLDKIKNVSVKDLLVILQREQESKSQMEDMLIQVSSEFY